MNWNILIRLLLLIKLRTADVLIALIKALTAFTRTKFGEMLTFVGILREDMKYISQQKAMIEVLNNKYDPTMKRIYIVDGTQTDVTFWSGDNENFESYAGENDNLFFAVPDSLTHTDNRFRVIIPNEYEDKKNQIYWFLRRYVFYGVRFIVITQSEYEG